MIYTLLNVVGGLTLFLYGLNIMRDSIETISKSKYQPLILKYTSNPFSAFTIGLLLTSISQSSSAITIITAALISVGTIKLVSGFYILVGANIGTCISAYIYSFDIGSFFLLFIIIGSIFYFLSNKKVNYKYLGLIFLGFGFIFLGLDFISLGINEFSGESLTKKIITNLDNSPWLFLLGGIVISGTLCSSSATIALIEQLYFTNILPYSSIIPLVLGANIGTTIANIIFALSLGKKARKLIYLNIIYNILGTLVFMILLDFNYSMLTYIISIFNISNKKIVVAIFHTLFNVLSGIIVLISGIIINRIKKNNVDKRQHIIYNLSITEKRKVINNKNQVT